MKLSFFLAAVVCSAVLASFTFERVAAQPRLYIYHNATINRFTRATLLATLSNATFEIQNVTNAAYTSVTATMTSTCASITLAIARFNYTNSTGIGVIRGALASTPFTTSFSDSTICNITLITFRGLVVSSIVATATNSSVFPPGVGRYINQLPSVNSMSAPSTVVRSGSQRDFIIGVGLPTSGTQGGAVLKLESLAGGICANVTGLLLGGTTTNASLSYSLSSNSDGCRLYLDAMYRLDFPGIGGGLVNKTNTLRYLVTGSPIASTGTPTLLYRTTQSVTFFGTNLPKGPGENPAVSIVISGSGSCIATTIPCAITSYGVGSITCLADLRGVRGNDTTGGCRISARITRLGLTSSTLTNVRCPDSTLLAFTSLSLSFDPVLCSSA
jgi:hypothetical protein